MTFRARLTLAYLVLLALAISAFGVGVYANVDRDLHKRMYDLVANEGANLSGELYNYDAVLHIKPQLEQTSQTPGRYVAVIGRKRGEKVEAVLGRTLGLTDTNLPEVPADARVHVVPASQNALNAPLAVYEDTFKAIKPAEGAAAKADQENDYYTGRVIVAYSLDSVNSSLRVLRNILVAGGFAVLAVAALLGSLIGAALLRPLNRMRQTAQRIGDERDFSRRMPVANTRDELGRLSVSFNQMLTELEQSHADLQGTLEAQRRFVADASHELRTPMTAIRTNVEFLARVPNAREADRRAALLDVLAEMRRMETLVGDLLALARLEAAARPARRPVRLDHLLADIHRDAARIAPDGVEVLLGPTCQVWVSGDRDDLRRAVWNLVENAIKYTPAGRVQLGLSSSDGTAELEVRDSGIGIAERDQALVFDRFWRASSARGMPGSGLGLAITKWVAQAHGGTVTVNSTVAEGSSFVLQLPAMPARRAPRAERRGAGVLAGARTATDQRRAAR